MTGNHPMVVSLDGPLTDKQRHDAYESTAPHRAYDLVVIENGAVRKINLDQMIVYSAE